MTHAESRISVIGAGYVGLVTAACLADLGHTVTCVEIDRERLTRLQRGDVPIYEPGLDEVVERNRRAGRLRFTDNYATAIPEAAFAFLAVPTPPAADGQADTSFVLAAVESILAHAPLGLIVVTKSTVPVGTGDAVARLATAAGRPDIAVVANPEFLREGSALADVMAPDRIVVGAASPAAAEAVASLFAPLGAPVVLTDRRSAELAKYAANALLATRVSFMNEVAGLCETVHADVETVARIVGLDHRIGPSFLRAGIGWGGSCFPKDVRALAATAVALGHRPSILQAVFDVNARQRDHACRLLLAAVGGRENATVGVLGLAFKPDTDDVREAPALEIIGRLLEAGVHVRAHDPVAVDNARRVLPQVTYGRDADDAAAGCDALLLATEWRDYQALDWRALGARMRGRVIFDGRNALDGGHLASLGFTYLSVGRAPRGPEPATLRFAAASPVPAAVGAADD